jgi:hypothetical protein
MDKIREQFSSFASYRCKGGWQSRLFLYMPVRIHLRNDLADDAASTLLKDWKKYIGDGQEKKLPHAYGPQGNALFFLYPEALPERLGIVGRYLMVSLPH